MKITKEAQDLLNQVLAENNADGLVVAMQETCCGKSPVFQIAVFDENDTPVEVDGIKLVVPEEAKEAIEDLIIDAQDGELVLLNTVCGCGDGGCGSHCHE